MQLETLRTRFEPALRWYFTCTGASPGHDARVRAVVLDRDDRVFLVKHSYVAGWHLPGGASRSAKTFRDALQRELAEEGRIEILGEAGAAWPVSQPPRVAPRPRRGLSGPDFRQDPAARAEPRDRRETGFFEASALPPETTPGTRLRIAEVLEGRPPSATWR